MKNLTFTLLLLLGFASVVSAQNSAYTILPNPVDTTTTPDVEDAPAIAHIENITTAAITVKWERIIISLSPGVYTQVCDPVTCWFEGVDTKTFTLGGGEIGELSVHFRNPTGLPASGIVHLKVTNLGDPVDTMTAVYTYSAVPLLGAHDLPVANVGLFPNPATDYFSLKNAEAVGSIRVFDLHGREVTRFEPSPGNTYSLANQLVGTYILALMDKDGQVFQAIEIQKR